MCKHYQKQWMENYYKPMKMHVDEIINIRRKIHTNPELPFKEYDTTNLIKKTVESWGLDFHRFSLLETGGYCDVGKGNTILFRSDIDAIPIEENPNHNIKSNNSGIMHACGHDFHTAIGLGLLRYFSNNRSELNGRLRVIFQPAEESAPGGAEKVVQENIWSNAEGILAVHVDPQLELGKIQLFHRAVQASSTSIYIELCGPGGHTSKPHETVDLISVTARYISQIQNYVNEKNDPRDTIAFAFGKIDGGDTHNSIPQKIILRGTIRTLDNKVLEKTKKLFINFSKNYGELYNTSISIKFPTSCPATINNPELANLFIKSMKLRQNEKMIELPEKCSMGADDFAYYLAKVPGLYLQIGAAGIGTLHSSDLLINEDIIGISLEYLTGFISDLLSE